MNINQFEFNKFCSELAIPITKRELLYTELLNSKKWYLENKNNLNNQNTAFLNTPPSEVFLTQHILDIYRKANNIDPTENTPTYDNFRADKRYIFFKHALILLGIKVKSLKNLFLTFFELIEGSTFRYKRLQCKNCNSRKVIKAGLNAAGNQRYKCSNCKKSVKRETNPHFHARHNVCCPYLDCGSYNTYKYGFVRGKQRYKCRECQITFLFQETSMPLIFPESTLVL